jgi:hypothetical protein
MSQLNNMHSVSHYIKNLSEYQNGIPHSSSCVMLSDQSSAFGVDEQGSLVKTNGVETSVTKRDVSTPFWIRQLNSTASATQSRST